MGRRVIGSVDPIGCGQMEYSSEAFAKLRADDRRRFGRIVEFGSFGYHLPVITKVPNTIWETDGAEGEGGWGGWQAFGEICVNSVKGHPVKQDGVEKWCILAQGVGQIWGVRAGILMKFSIMGRPFRMAILTTMIF